MILKNKPLICQCLNLMTLLAGVRLFFSCTPLPPLFLPTRGKIIFLRNTVANCNGIPVLFEINFSELLFPFYMTISTSANAICKG